MKKPEAAEKARDGVCRGETGLLQRKEGTEQSVPVEEQNFHISGKGQEVTSAY